MSSFTNIESILILNPHSIVESSLRTMNNLLERLHASFFFYFLSGPNSFLKIGEYLPSVIIISTAIMFGGLKLWVDAGWVANVPPMSLEKDSQLNSKKLRARQRNVFLPLGIVISTHVTGGFIFLIATSSWFSQFQFVRLFCFLRRLMTLTTSLDWNFILAYNPRFPNHFELFIRVIDE